MTLPDPDTYFREYVDPHFQRVFGEIPKPEPLESSKELSHD
jgi:hypothetical protein